MENAHDSSLHEMLRKVNIQLSKRESASGLKQCMEIRVIFFAFKRFSKQSLFNYRNDYSRKAFTSILVSILVQFQFHEINIGFSLWLSRYSRATTSLTQSSWLVTLLYTPGNPGTAHL